MRFEPIEIGSHKLIALRMGMAGEVGFELQGPIEHANEIHQTIFKEGQAFGIRRLGKRTSMINHLEASFPTGWFHYVPVRPSVHRAGGAGAGGRQSRAHDRDARIQ
jgi:vanillate/3-O-methylgallate O-demethylase